MTDSTNDSESTVPAPLALWGVPRSRSTAFFRMMVERGDFAVAHEPFSELAANRKAWLAGHEISDQRLLLQSMFSHARPVFFKETTEYPHANLFSEHPSMYSMTHTFIIRDPRRVINSHFAVNPDVTCAEIGFENLYDIFQILRDRLGKTPVVVDSDLLVRQPGEIISAYCRRIGIPPRTTALTWAPGARDEWEATNRWHSDVATTSGFRPDERIYDRTTENEPRLTEYLDHHLPFYESLLELSLQTSGSRP